MLALGGCATGPKPELLPLGDVIPADVSLAGHWQLRDAAEDAERRLRDAQQQAAGGLADIVAPTRQERGRREPRRSDGPSVQVFLELGRNLKITQTEYALFISFDRSVVEEYRYREHRQVNVGPIQADRVSGWQDGRYVIETLDEKGALLTDTYALEAGGTVLVRSLRIVYKDVETLSMRQQFDRVD